MGDLRSALSNFEKVLDVCPDNCDTLKVSELKLKDIRFVFHYLHVLAFFFF